MKQAPCMSWKASSLMTYRFVAKSHLENTFGSCDALLEATNCVLYPKTNTMVSLRLFCWKFQKPWVEDSNAEWRLFFCEAVSYDHICWTIRFVELWSAASCPVADLIDAQRMSEYNDQNIYSAKMHTFYSVSVGVGVWTFYFLPEVKANCF